MYNRKTAYKEVSRSVNTSTGEVVELVNNYITTRKVTQSEFLMIYLDNIDAINAIKSVNGFKIFNRLCKELNYNDNSIYISPEIRAEISSEIGVSIGAFNNIISTLKKMGILYGNRGFYRINPHIVWRGSEKERQKEIEKLRNVSIDRIGDANCD